jgi:hypothetical protein
METRTRLIDTFQIIGFAASTALAILLVLLHVDPMQSTMTGLILAIFVQLFDLQLRSSKAEERLLQANALNQGLYRDPGLLGKVRQMVDDYYTVTSGWFDLYKARGEHAVSECHRVLRSMASGTMEPPPGSQFNLSANALRIAQKSIKQVTDFNAIRGAPEGVRTWYSRSWAEAAQRGVQMTMVLVLSRQDLSAMLANASTVEMPVGTHIAISEELPPDLDENYLIVDDRVVSISERRADATVVERTISIVPIEVERMAKRFDQALRYARPAEDVLRDMNRNEPR